MPTEDVRRFAAWALHALFPISSADISGTVFPGLDMGDNPGLIA